VEALAQAITHWVDTRHKSAVARLAKFRTGEPLIMMFLNADLLFDGNYSVSKKREK
jgi:hypothetical protein